MTVYDDRTLLIPRPPHPVHAVLLAGTVPLFLGSMLSDIAYASSYHIQWNNFASWLIAGGLVFAGFALVCALVDMFRRGRRGSRAGIHFLLLLATWLSGFLNALIHARDAWASMPSGLILSVLVFALALGATWTGFATSDPVTTSDTGGER